VKTSTSRSGGKFEFRSSPLILLIANPPATIFGTASRLALQRNALTKFPDHSVYCRQGAIATALAPSASARTERESHSHKQEFFDQVYSLIAVRPGPRPGSQQIIEDGSGKRGPVFGKVHDRAPAWSGMTNRG
jgi:hypothetical protein